MNIPLERIAALNLQGHEWETISGHRVLRAHEIELRLNGGILSVHLRTDAGTYLLAGFATEKVMALMAKHPIRLPLGKGELFASIHTV